MRNRETFTIKFDEQTLPIIEQISEGMPGGFFIYHADGDEELIHCNGAMLRIFGCDTPEAFRELTGYTFKGIVHPADLDRVEESIKNQIAHGGDDLDYVEYRIVRKDGTVRWVEDYGHFIRTEAYGDLFYVFIEDATERIQKRMAELERVNEALYGAQLREDYFKRALLHDAVSFVEINLTRDEFISASMLNADGEVQNLFSFMGIRPFEKYSDFVTFWADFTEADELDGYHRFFDLARLIRCYETGEREQTYDCWVKDMYGRKRLSHYMFFLEKNEHTGDVTALSVSQDITEQVERQSLLKSALRQAETERLTRNTFFANMSHDIRTPLNAIIGYAELLKGCVGDPGKVGECIEKINYSGEELLAVFDEFLRDNLNEPSRAELTEREYHLGELIREVEKTAERPIRAKQIEFTVDKTELFHFSVEVDYIRLREILNQLLDNAVKYTSSGGRVSLTVTEEKSDRKDCGLYRFVISDSGCGISEERLETIFQPAKQERYAVYNGMPGGSLAIVKSYVETMGGSISVESRVGEGSAFTVSLPIKYPGRGSYMEQEDAAGTPESAEDKGCILLVEDNGINRDMEAELLKNLGYRVETACDGVSAYDLLKDSAPGRFSLVLMDIEMPGMDGYETTAAIRRLENEAVSGIPIIALSSDAMEEDRKRSLRAGMNEHFVKPVDIDVLQAVIDRILGDKERG
ncbi:MAG: response regulator [Bacteroidales bacterium]|nr:response regulator [Bacteroidales bacterium]MCM1416026.1 response regulator [bacterium]MCM1423837.1 response regulator [bacterium]